MLIRSDRLEGVLGLGGRAMGLRRRRWEGRGGEVSLDEVMQKGEKKGVEELERMKLLPNEHWMVPERLSRRQSEGAPAGGVVGGSGLGVSGKTYVEEMQLSDDLLQLEGWVLKGWKRQRKFLRLRGGMLSIHEGELTVAREVVNLYQARMNSSVVTKHLTIRSVGSSKNVTLFFEGDTSKFRRWVSLIKTATSTAFEDQYELLDRIGGGSFGSVRLARRRQDGLIFAVKITNRKRATEKELSLMETELRVLLSMRQNNNISLEEAYMADGSAYLVMEYLSGGSLEELLTRKGRLEEASVRTVIRALLRAVFQLHDLDIVHRDVKLENVVLAGNEGDAAERTEDSVKLVDFGLCAVLSDVAPFVKGQAKNYALNGVVGTWDYLAPEVLMKRSYGAPVDMWACGMCLHQLLTGELPTKLVSEEDKSNGDHSIISHELRRRASPTLVCFLEGLLERDPVRRLTAWEALMHPWLRESRTQDIPRDYRLSLRASFNRTSSPNLTQVKIWPTRTASAVTEIDVENEQEREKKLDNVVVDGTLPPLGGQSENVFCETSFFSTTRDEHAWVGSKAANVPSFNRFSSMKHDRASQSKSRGVYNPVRSVSTVFSRLRKGTTAKDAKT